MICKTFEKKTKLTICKYLKHVWKCFRHRAVIDRSSKEDEWGVFRLIFNHRDLTNTHEIPALWLRVFKNGWQNLVRYPDSQRWYTKQMKERFVWYQDKMKSETRITSGSVSSNIPRPPVEIYKHEWECFNWYQDTIEVFKKSRDPFFPSILMFLNIGWNTSF